MHTEESELMNHRKKETMKLSMNMNVRNVAVDCFQ